MTVTLTEPTPPSWAVTERVVVPAFRPVTVKAKGAGGAVGAAGGGVPPGAAVGTGVGVAGCGVGVAGPVGGAVGASDGRGRGDGIAAVAMLGSDTLKVKAPA